MFNPYITLNMKKYVKMLGIVFSMVLPVFMTPVYLENPDGRVIPVLVSVLVFLVLFQWGRLIGQGFRSECSRSNNETLESVLDLLWIFFLMVVGGGLIYLYNDCLQWIIPSVNEDLRIIIMVGIIGLSTLIPRKNRSKEITVVKS